MLMKVVLVVVVAYNYVGILSPVATRSGSGTAIVFLRMRMK